MASRYIAVAGVLARIASAQAPGALSFVVPAGFPSQIFSDYYSNATSTSEPQPKIYDPVLNITYPLPLTDPYTIPSFDADRFYLPEPLGFIFPDVADTFVAGALAQIYEINDGQGIAGNCSKCVASLNVLKSLALVIPERVPETLVTLCKHYSWHNAETCEEDFETTTFGAVWTQIIALGDVSGLDGRYMCNSFWPNSCTKPPAYPVVNATSMFAKPKPANATAPKASGKRVKVLHMSDLHLDPRYAVASEANCTSGLCCRSNVNNTALSAGQVSSPAPLYGSFLCDTPYFLATAAFQSIHPLTNTTDGNASSLGWTVYTGDLVSHDPQTQLSRAYTEYTETSVYSMMHYFLKGPVFAALGMS